MRVPFPLTEAASNLGEICALALDESKSSHPDNEFRLERIGD